MVMMSKKGNNISSDDASERLIASGATFFIQERGIEIESRGFRKGSEEREDAEKRDGGKEKSTSCQQKWEPPQE